MNNKYPYSESNNRKMETGSDMYTSAFALIKLHLTKIATTRRGFYSCALSLVVSGYRCDYN